MYRMLTGQPPYYKPEPMNGNLEAQLAAYRKLILSSPRPEAHRAVPGVDHELAGIIDHCLATSPANRFHNPQAVVSAIDAWKLRRVRRPLLFMVTIGFAMMLLVIAAIGAYLFKTSINTAQREVIDRALEGNRFAAKSEARQLGLQMQFRWEQLEGAAREPLLREVLLKGNRAKDDPQSNWILDSLLTSAKDRSDNQFDETDQSSLWFVDDASGFQLSLIPPSEAHRHLYRGYRDYFHGLGKELDDRNGPPAAIIHAPYRSIVFHRDLDSGKSAWSVAFSVPVWSGSGPTEREVAPRNKQPIGVVGMMLDLKGHTRVAGERERFAVLIDTRPDSKGMRGLILRHPYQETVTLFTEGRQFYSEDVVRWVDAGGEFAPEKDYIDPVGDSYAGAWLASVERVKVRPDDHTIDTGWVILVQERRNEVLSPVWDLEWRIGIAAAVATLLILILIVLLSAGVISILEDAPKSRITRFLRRWVGLSTAGSAISATSVVSSAVENKTPHGGSGAATPGTASKTPG
jgi:hypothetical protein